MKSSILLLLLAMLPCAADLPLTYPEFVQLYGPPDATPGARPIGGYSLAVAGTQFSSDGIAITINGGATDGITFIHYLRPTPFAELEIGELLKPLSASEAWVEQPDGKTWLLPKAGARAVWDGEGKISVTAK